ncbi:MAG: head GIN domain-containing protein [Chloroflexota bacterium]|nr:head GIN domain-containing protein [Chloroflexota bacterium]
MRPSIVAVAFLTVLLLLACGPLSCLSSLLMAPFQSGLELPGLLPANAVIGSGRVVTETRQVRDFSALVAGGSGDVVVIQGDKEGLVVEAEDNLLALIGSEVDNGTLRLGLAATASGVSIRATRPIRYLLSVKSLESASLNGSGNLAAAGLQASWLQLTISGSGGARVDQVRANEIVADIRGSGSAELAGKASRQTVSIAGSGDYRAGNLDSDVARVTIAASGSASVWSRQQLAVQMLGIGTVSYYGLPTVPHSITGSGRLRSLGEHRDRALTVLLRRELRMSLISNLRSASRWGRSHAPAPISGHQSPVCCDTLTP